MTQDAEPPPPLTAVQRASDGQFGRIDLWREAVGDAGGPSLMITAVIVIAFFAGFASGGPAAWGLSGAALSEGRWWTLGSHMLAHAGLGHLWLNVGGLLSLGPYVSINAGRGFRRWAGTVALFIVSGLVGAIAFVAVNPTDSVPMVGASGAICGLWGAAARFDPDGSIASLRSRRVREQIRSFAIMNVVVFGILFAITRAVGASGGLAWEAHLGGFLFGLLIGPRLKRR